MSSSSRYHGHIGHSAAAGALHSSASAPAFTRAQLNKSAAAAEHERIQIAPIGASDDALAMMVPADPRYDCSWRTMCGPKPKVITGLICIFIAVWASMILGAHLQKKVGGGFTVCEIERKS